MNLRREIFITVVCISVVVGSIGAFLADFAQERSAGPTTLRFAVEAIVFILAVTLQAYGNVIYGFARLGYLRRQKGHQPASRSTLESIYDRIAPRLCILVPSYKEEQRVLLQTILSAALLEYPHRRVVLLIDDPPQASGADLASLQAARSLVAEIDRSFALRSRAVERDLLNLVTIDPNQSIDLAQERARLAQHYADLAEWVETWSQRVVELGNSASAHTDELFVELILRAPSKAHRARSDILRSCDYGRTQLTKEYRRLLALTKVKIESFERKHYVNLSHEPNKAMNLNSYIGLIGGRYREERRSDGVWLVESEPQEATLTPPPAEFLLTIDADSFVLPDYALRLVDLMERDERMAVAQTPYSAVPSAPRMIERAAGATTDIQYFVHQGFTRYDATYWVGANALLRLSALQDICKFVEERGHRVPVFIQDRTVIEDTGSTVDLISRGWRLYNYPERLAYSATPPDFGALIIQRRRWSNGGLIILPDLLRHLRTNGISLRWLGEAAMRVYYLCSPSVASFALLTLLLYRFDDTLANVWLPLAALPYFFLYGRDLRRAGYGWLDLFRVYALNLLLLPVNIAGVLRSVQQLLTGRKAPFGRTPKVEFRTFVPPIYIAFLFGLLAYLIVASVVDIAQRHYSHAGFAFLNAFLLVYSISTFIGWRESLVDLREGLRRFGVPVGPMAALPVTAETAIRQAASGASTSMGSRARQPG